MKKVKNKASLDPFAISLAERQAASEEQQWALTQKLYDRYANWIQQQFQQTGAALLVLCDREVIYSSADRYDFRADEVVAQTEQQRKKPCFILTRPLLVEETSAWSDLGQGDYYPTVELFLGARAWSESEVFSRGASVIGDFDTGNPALAIFDESLCHRLSGEHRPARQDVHLGRLYRYRPRLMKVGVEDGQRRRVIERVVEGVESWNDPSRNPFKLANPNRQGFVGRDLMFQLLFQITLHPQKCQSEWSLL
jgi:hypothetical protein